MNRRQGEILQQILIFVVGFRSSTQPTEFLGVLKQVVILPYFLD